MNLFASNCGSLGKCANIVLFNNLEASPPDVLVIVSLELYKKKIAEVFLN
jgi:hypothetical protein